CRSSGPRPRPTAPSPKTTPRRSCSPRPRRPSTQISPHRAPHRVQAPTGRRTRSCSSRRSTSSSRLARSSRRATSRAYASPSPASTYPRSHARIRTSGCRCRSEQLGNCVYIPSPTTPPFWIQHCCRLAVLRTAIEDSSLIRHHPRRSSVYIVSLISRTAVFSLPYP
ncbi:hypothetical protein B0H15DRAFT_1017863, partial [Mycena belliarum]